MLKQLLSPRRTDAAAVSPGLRHYARQANGRTLRYHLRVEPDGSGLLVANASEACLLSPSGVLVARRLLEGASPSRVETELRAAFRGVTHALAHADVERVRAMMDEMVRPGSRFPLRSLDEASHVQGRALGAPLVADVELHGVEGTAEVLRRLWDIGVPQAVLLVPDASSVDIAVALVDRAEKLGMIIGVRGRATDVGGEAALEKLAGAGLDRADLFFAHARADVHDALFGGRDHERTLAAFAALKKLEVCPVAIAPLVATTWNDFGDTTRVLRDAGVTTLVAYPLVRDGATPPDLAVTPSALPQVEAFAAETADALDVTLLACPPIVLGATARAQDVVRDGPVAAGDAAVRIRHDGAVLRASGGKPAGDLLRDRWEAIWAEVTR